jgi:hypothetical protein
VAEDLIEWRSLKQKKFLDFRMTAILELLSNALNDQVELFLVELITRAIGYKYEMGKYSEG